MIEAFALIAGLCIGAVFGLRVGESREAGRWRFASAKAGHYMNSGTEAYIVMQTAQFYEEYHNPLVRFRRQEKKS